MLKIYMMFKAQYLKTAFAYTANFWMMFIAGVVGRTLTMAIPYVIMRNVPSIAGWQEAEVYVIMSLIFISEGCSNLFYDGIWELPGLVFNGEFDVMLARPVSPLYQVIARGFGLQGTGGILVGFAGLILSMHSLGWLTPAKILACLVLIVGGAVLRLSSILTTASVTFYLNIGSGSGLMFAANNVGEYAQYPVDIYPGWLKIILLTILPYGFIGYVPALILRQDTIGLLFLGAVAFIVVFFLLARGLFYLSIRKYESMGM